MQPGQQFPVFASFCRVHAPGEAERLPLVIRQGQVLQDRQVRARALRRVLEHAADAPGAPEFRHFRDVLPVQQDAPFFRGQRAADQVEHARLARPVGADDGNEFALIHPEVEILEQAGLVHRAGVEGQVDVLQFHQRLICAVRFAKHVPFLLSSPRVPR